MSQTKSPLDYVHFREHKIDKYVYCSPKLKVGKAAGLGVQFVGWSQRQDVNCPNCLEGLEVLERQAIEVPDYPFTPQEHYQNPQPDSTPDLVDIFSGKRIGE